MANPDRVHFDEKQQAKVDELLNAAFGKGYRKGAGDAALEINSLKARIAELENKPVSWWRR